MGHIMADYTFDQAHYAPEPRSETAITSANITNWVGAAVSVGLVVGACVWGYRVMMRDVSGIPVVQAAEGPMRIQPENPGGQLADNQGLAVNAVAGSSLAEAPAQRLVLAPVPAGLGEDDIAQKDLELIAASAVVDPVENDASVAGLAVLEDAVASGFDSGDATAGDGTDPIDALANQLAVNAAHLDASIDDAVDAALADAETEALESDLKQHSNTLAQSLRPLSRPAGARVRVASTQPLTAQSAASVVRASANSAVEIDHATLPAGTRLVQIGAFPDAQTARSEWDRVSGFMGDFLAGKQRVVMQAQSGGRTIYRLRVHGFADLSEARRFCATSIEKNVDCIPVVTK